MSTLVAHLAALALALGSAVWPLTPRPEVVEGFAPPAEQWGPGHRGVDLSGHPGQPVHAAEAGVVSFAGRLAGRGVVVVSHGDTRTTYEPVTATVHRGQAVRGGQRLGSLETFGSHCWPRACLHWGLLRGETYLDPLTLLGAGPVRLLPLVGPTERWLTLDSGALSPAAPAATPAGVPGGRPSEADPW